MTFARTLSNASCALWLSSTLGSLACGSKAPLADTGAAAASDSAPTPPTPVASDAAQVRAVETAPDTGATVLDTSPPAPERSPDPRPKVARDTTCLPAWFQTKEYDPNAPSEITDTPPSLVLGRVSAAVVLCGFDDDSEWLAGPLGCWDVDVASGALKGREPMALPGRGFAVVREKGCARGYCAPHAASTNDPVLLATSSDGRNTVMVTPHEEMTYHVFDAASKKHLRSFENSTDKDDGKLPLAVGNTPIGLVYIGNTFYVVGTDAGPFIGVWAFREDGTRLGALVDAPAKGPDDYPDLTSVWGGSVSVLDDTRLGVSVAGLDELRLVAPDQTRTTIKRKTPKNPCSREQMDLMGEGVEPRSKCGKHLAKVYLPWAGASIVALPAGGYLALQKSGTLVFLDDKLALLRRAGPVFCK